MPLIQNKYFDLSNNLVYANIGCEFNKFYSFGIM